MNREELKAHLLKLANKEIYPDEPDEGICWELEQFLDIDCSLMRDVANLFGKWPKFSGNYDYPVSHPRMKPSSAFDDIENLWGDHEYGDNRRDLCRFIAENL